MFEEMRSAGSNLFAAGVVAPGCGSLSERRGDRIYITRADANLADITGESVMEVPLEGGSVDDTSIPRDIGVHRAIYKATSAMSVVVSNAPEIVALSITEGKIIPQDSSGLSILRSIPIIRASVPVNYDDVVRTLPSLVSEVPGAVSVKGFGAYCFGKTGQEAARAASVLLLSCRMLMMIKALTPAPQKVETRKHEHRPAQRSAIPPGIGVMDRSRSRYRR